MLLEVHQLCQVDRVMGQVLRQDQVAVYVQMMGRGQTRPRRYRPTVNQDQAYRLPSPIRCLAKARATGAVINLLHHRFDGQIILNPNLMPRLSLLKVHRYEQSMPTQPVLFLIRHLILGW